MAQAVWKLKVVWDHAGTGTVRSRNIHQQIERAEKRLCKLNTVEATRLAGANDALKRVMRTCRGGGELNQAAKAETGALVTQQLEPSGQDPVESSKRAGRRTPSRAAPTRVTPGGRAKAEAASRLKAEAKRQQDERNEELAQEAQETGPEGSRILCERGAEVQEWGRQTAGKEDDDEPQGASGDGSRWAGWWEEQGVGGCGPSSGVYAHCLGRPRHRLEAG
jgi:hypothetical protein